MSDPHFNFSEMICFSLYATSNAMIRDYRLPLEACDLTYPQFVVMMALWNLDKISIKKISQQTLFDAGTLTQILARLEQKNLIKSIRSETDKRSKIIVVTPKGIELEEKTSHIFPEMECKLALTVNEQKTIIEVCQKILSRLAKYDEQK